MAQGFVLAGHEIVSDENEADYRVVNTCTVTSSAASKSRRAAKPSHAAQRIIVTGCDSEVRPEAFDRADLVVRNAEKDSLVSLALERFGMDGFALGADYRSDARLSLFPLILNHTRAFVKIQDGCNMRCTFCLTTFARGPSRCRSPEDIVAEVRDLAEKGCREVVLTGVHAGSYGHGDVDLGGLIERVLAESDIERLRLSSLEPWNFKYSWMNLWDRFGTRLCRQLHMSLQSGSDTVLKRMRRVYDAASYTEKVAHIRERSPDLALTTDIIVGFPGETDNEHRNSLAFVKEMGFARSHVFTFSAREGTEASTMPGQIPNDIRSRRFADMKSVTDASQRDFAQRMAGRILPVLWEEAGDDGNLYGLTDNYLRVRTSSPAAELNTTSDTLIVTDDAGPLNDRSIRAQVILH